MVVRNILLIVVCNLVLANADISAQNVNPKEPIKIGAILHLTGDQAMQGAAFRDGIALAEHEINAQGGIVGHELKVIYEDSQLKPVVAHSAAKRLISVEKVVGAIDASFLEVMANGAEFERAKIPVITLWDSSPAIEVLGDYVFGIGVWTPSAGEEAARFSKRVFNARSAVVVSMTNEWSEAVAKYFVEEFKRGGGRIIDQVSLIPETSDFKSILGRLNRNKPDVLYAAVTDNVIAFYSQLRQVAPELPIITSDIVNEAHLAERPEIFKYLFQTQAADPNSDAAVKFSEAFKVFHGAAPSQVLLSAWGYDAVMLFKKAIEQGGVSPAQIKDKLYSMPVYSGASGSIKFTKEGSSPQPERVFKVKGSRFELAQ